MSKKMTKEEKIKRFKKLLKTEYDYEKNKDIDVKELTFGSNKKVWWKCSKEHKWKARVADRTAGNGCPYCSGRYTCKDNCLSTTHPKLAKEWNYEKNNITPEEVSAGSNKKIWWKCSKEHEWEAIIQSRKNGIKNCIICNSLSTTHPELLKEWNYEKNNITPEEVRAGSKKKVWWKCSKGHEWEAVINNKTNGVGCPLCNSGWTIEKIRLFIKNILSSISSMNQIEWMTFLYQSGILDIDRTAMGHAFINRIVNREALDMEDLENFANGEPSGIEDAIETGDDTLLENEDIIDLFDDIEEENDELPELTVRDTFNVLENNESYIANMDEEAVNTLISEAMWKLIQIICEDKTKIKEIRKKKKSKYSVIAQERFIKLYDRVENFKLPKGYNFRIEGKKIAPNFMQKLNTILLLDKKRFLNLSGCGAGKTLSAVISSRLIKNSV